MTIVTRGPRERSWKFQDLASQETNRRWDSPIANSFRVEEPLSIQFIEPLCFYPSLLPPPPSSLRCPPPAPRLFRLTFPGYIPYSARVGIQRPHNRLLTHSIFLPYPLTRPLSAHPPFSLSLSFSASSSFHCRLGRIFHRRRNAVLPFPRKRNETEEERRCKRRRREESTIGEGSRRRSEERRRWITREVGRHADDKEADTMTGLFSARFEYIGSLWRGMNW